LRFRFAHLIDHEKAADQEKRQCDQAYLLIDFPDIRYLLTNEDALHTNWDASGKNTRAIANGFELLVIERWRQR
jgi:hypothetical protein